MRASEDIARVDSEAGIIATLFHHPEYSFYSEDLLPNHFTNKENRYIYQAICSLAREGITTVDPYNIIQSLSSSEATRHLADELSVEQLYTFMENSDSIARNSVEEYTLAQQGALTEDEYYTAVQNTNEIAALCENFKLDSSIKYPILYGSQEEDERIFEARAWESLDDKLNSGVIPREQETAFRSAIEEELRVFKKLKMSGFMLSMSDLIRWCKENGMAIGTARGSVGGSRAAYVTDIIDLNPETWHTVFSRFCNEDRQEIGDIDVDVVYDDRPRIFEYITSRFGADKTARVAAYGTLADKSVIDEVCRALASTVDKEKYSVARTSEIKKAFVENPDAARKKYPEVFYYYDGLAGTRVSQSVHPAGMVISPITLDDNYGTFSKDGETCLLMDMDEAHEVGAAKYDFLALKTVKVIRDTCNYIGIPYPQTNTVNWNDENVWRDMCNNLTAIFQFESSFAADCFKKFQPSNIFDMSLVTACIRPSGASYRDQLLARKQHHNPSKIIDDLLADNLGYLIYQEDTIKFLQQICGLSGSEADNIRRAIGRKQKDRLDAALPSILEGYCNKSPQERSVAEAEAKEFLQIIEDSASYQFGYNHSVAYCLLGYLCGYFRYYYPIDLKGLELDGGIYPTDIDGIIEYRDSEYIILEVKHHKAKVPWGQQLCLQRMAIAIVCEHEVDNPDIPVVAALCNVRELYYGGEREWRPPDEPMTVRQAILSFQKYSKKQKRGKR